MDDKFKNLITCFEKLPGVGKKSAIKYAYFVSFDNKVAGLNLANAIEEGIKFLKRCEICNGICENEICEICTNTSRESEKICVVENSKDIMVLEEAKIFDGLYFVLDSLEESNIDKLKNMIEQKKSKEIIFALTPGLNSDGIMLFIEDRLKDLDIKFSKIAQGIPTGVSLENVDMLSLMKAIDDRREF